MAPKYRGVAHAFHRILKDEGLTVGDAVRHAASAVTVLTPSPGPACLKNCALQAFWKGNGMAIILYVMYGAIQFGTYYELKKLYGGYVRCARILPDLFYAFPH